MLATIRSGALWGVESLPVDVEVNGGERGELRFVLVGLPDAAVKESLDRVCSALQNSGFKLPHTRTTINLSPGHIRKEGPIYDLPIALGMLIASGQLQSSTAEFLIAGELSLSGKLLPIRGAISLAIQAKRSNFRGVILPEKSAREALLIEGVEIYGVRTLGEAVGLLGNPSSFKSMARRGEEGEEANVSRADDLDFSDVCGQERTKRAAEIAVAGGHNLLMIGCPGVGKSMIAKRIPSIMPRPTLDELIEIYGIHSAAGLVPGEGLGLGRRPFRAPHHTISRYGLIGGGAHPKPGEISLAHNGVLFLDELAEFSRSTLETLRQPLDDGHITISRSGGKVSFPSGFTLVTAMNPCPCGYLGSKKRRCSCSNRQILEYRARISGPLLDRMDLHIDVPAVPAELLAKQGHGGTSAQIRRRVEAARDRQRCRFLPLAMRCNGHIAERFLRDFCSLGEAERTLLQQAMNQGALSARAHGKILRVSRTIADLDGSEPIQSRHLIEALQYRALDW